MAQATDIILMVAAVAALIWGAYKGFVVQIVGIISIVVALWLSSRLTPGVAAWINEYFGSDTSLDIIKICVYIVLFIVIVILCKLVGSFVKRIFNLTILGIVDKILGALFCLFKVILIAAALAYLVNQTGEKLSLEFLGELKKSNAYTFLLEVSDNLLPYLKSMF